MNQILRVLSGWNGFINRDGRNGRNANANVALVASVAVKISSWILNVLKSYDQKGIR
jgi:hypothetical protein